MIFRNIISGIAGGLIVLVLGIIGLQVGIISSGDNSSNSTTSSSPSISKNFRNNPHRKNSVQDIYRNDGPGVGFIFSESKTKKASGSGFFIDKSGHMVTNNHVVSEATDVSVSLGGAEKTYKAEIVGKDPSTDLALLKVKAPPAEITPLSLGNSDKLTVGDPVVAIGNPFGLDRTVTTGIISALQREMKGQTNYSISNVIQTDAAINPGNSGGPLIDMTGNVIGVNSQIATGGVSNGNIGIGFAVPSNVVKDVVNQIKETGSVKHPFLGISAATITPDVSKALNLKTKGALVQFVVKNGPAAKAGIQAGDAEVGIKGLRVMSGGDIITEIDGKDIYSVEDVINKVNESKVGDKLKLTIIRNDKEKSLTVKLGSR